MNLALHQLPNTNCNKDNEEGGGMDCRSKYFNSVLNRVNPQCISLSLPAALIIAYRFSEKREKSLGLNRLGKVP